MKLSTKVRYGLRAMLDLAKHAGASPVLLKDVAERQNISGSYLANIFSSLVAAKLVVSKRGSRGGFNLARGASRIKLSEIVGAIEGHITLVECIADPQKCVKTETCALRIVWARMAKAMSEVLESITLQGLIKLDEAKTGKSAKMYYI